MTHPNKEIREAVAEALARGWRLVPSRGHAWGRLFCPEASRDGHCFSIWSTPRNPQNHAADLRRALDRCPHSAPRP